jgi:hypothetical protein
VVVIARAEATGRVVIIGRAGVVLIAGPSCDALWGVVAGRVKEETAASGVVTLTRVGRGMGSELTGGIGAV